MKTHTKGKIDVPHLAPESGLVSMLTCFSSVVQRVVLLDSSPPPCTTAHSLAPAKTPAAVRAAPDSCGYLGV